MKMKLFFLAVLLFCVHGPICAGDAAAVREQVWKAYLSDADSVALQNSLPPEDPQARAVAPGGPPAPEALVAMRSGFEQFVAEFAPPPASVPYEAFEKGSVKGVWFNPADADQSRVLLYFHGGGFVAGSPMTAASIAGTLAERARIRCFSLDYPLAPEAPYPAAHDNAVEAYAMLLDSGYAAENIVLAGDSAGGNLALGTLLRIRDRSLPMPAGAYLLSPWTDLGNSLPTQELKRNIDPIISIAELNMMAGAYAANRDLKDPPLSPVFADLRGLPPLLIHVGSHEILLDDSITVARNAALADVPITLKVWPGYGHVFQMGQSMLEGGRKALAEGAEFCGEVLTKTHLRE